MQDLQLERVEAERQKLEQNVAKLQRALRHWQDQEIEYEELKEEVEKLPAQPAELDLARVQSSFTGHLITAQDVKSLAVGGRTRQQIKDQLSRRIEYVQRNVESVSRQLDDALRHFRPNESEDEVDGARDEGLPLTDIIEELDDDGNVTSSRIIHPDDDMARKLLKQTQGKSTSGPQPRKDISANESPSPDATASLPSVPDRTLDEAKPHVEPSSPTAGTQSVDIPKKKSVSFAEDTKPGTEKQEMKKPSEVLPLSTPSPSYQGRPGGYSTLAEGSFTDKERVLELDENDKPIAVNAHSLPEGESEEDAAMRRQMLQYSMNEMNAIVAELDLEEASSSFQSDDDDSDDMSTDEEDDDDDYGLSRKKWLGNDSEYREQMLALERKLNANSFVNAGAARSDDIEHTDVLGNEDASALESKAVRFDGDSLRDAATSSKPAEPTKSPQSKPFIETIVERSSVLSGENAPISQRKEKVSRFRANHQFSSQGSQSRQPGTATTAQQDVPLANTVVERVPPNNASSPTPPSEFDKGFLHKQIADEYYRKRNAMIHKQGGFIERESDLGPEDAEVEPDETPVQNGGRKVSLFKAARIKAKET